MNRAARFTRIFRAEPGCHVARRKAPSSTTTRSTHLGDFEEDLLVECPRCHRCAHLGPVPAPVDRGYRLSCLHCGHVHDWPGASYYLPRGGPEVGGYGVSLWLRTPCCGETLWANNGAHLAFLEMYVGAKLRGRVRHPRWGWANKSLDSRLPVWMKAASNRPAVLEAIAKLRAKLAEG